MMAVSMVALTDIFRSAQTRCSSQKAVIPSGLHASTETAWLMRVRLEGLGLAQAHTSGKKFICRIGYTRGRPGVRLSR